MSELKMAKNRIVRYAWVVAAAAGVSWGLASQRLSAQDDQAAPAAEAGEPAPDAAEAPDAPAAPEAPADADAKPASEDAAGAAESSPVLARAGDITVTIADVEAFVASMPAQDQPQVQAQLGSNPQAKKQVVEHLLNTKALAREGERLKLDADAKVAKRLQSAREQILAGAVAASLGAANEAGDKAYFEENKERFDRVQARHILVATRSTDPNSKKKPLSDEQAKKKADEIRSRLEKGEDFAALAKAESDDPGSKATGGEYTFGRVGRENRMVAPFEKAAYALKENEISQPVKTEFGYHVIQLQKRIPVTFEEVRGKVGQERFDSKIKELLGGEPVFEPKFFGAGAGAGAAGAKPADKAPAGKGAK